MLVWNSEIHMRLGHVGLVIVDKKALRSENDTQTKENFDEKITSCKFLCANEGY
jgi:hypothetical protein